MKLIRGFNIESTHFEPGEEFFPTNVRLDSRYRTGIAVEGILRGKAKISVDLLFLIEEVSWKTAIYEYDMEKSKPVIVIPASATEEDLRKTKLKIMCAKYGI